MRPLSQKDTSVTTPHSDKSDDAPESKPVFKGLPSFGSYMDSPGDEADVINLYRCGECEIPSADVRGYSLLTVALLPFFIFWRVDKVMKCPRCMRRHIIFRLPLTILLSHIVSPFVVTWWLVVYVKTFFSRRG